MLNVAGAPALDRDAEAPQPGNLISVAFGSSISVPASLAWLGLVLEPVLHAWEEP